MKYRQNFGVCSFGVEVVADLLGGRSVYDGGKGVRRSLLDAAYTSEVFNQTLSRPWPDARYREQLTISVAHLPPLAVIGHGKTVTLVANLLHQVEHGRPPIQHHRLVLLSIDVDDLLALCNGREWLQRDANLLERRVGRVQLTESTVDQDERRERFLVLLQPFVTALDHLAHTSEVIDAGDGLHLKLAVIGLLHSAVLPYHHGGHRLRALDMRDIEAFDPARQFLQRQCILQGLLNRLHSRLQYSKPLIVRLLRILAYQIDERTLFAALRCQNLNAPSRSLSQYLCEKCAIGKLHRHENRSRHVALVEIDLLQQRREEHRRAERSAGLRHRCVLNNRYAF